MAWIRKNLLKGILIVVVVIVAGRLLFPSRVSTPVAESANIKTVATEQAFKTIVSGAGSKLLVFDLYADWCGPCRKLHPTMEALAGKYAGTVGFYRVNVDANPKVATLFGTDGIPFVVFVKDGQTVASLVGLNPSESYEKIITAYSPALNTPSGKAAESL